MVVHYVERALFVVGAQNSGKSTQLRSLFSDVRFGTKGEIPSTRRITEVVRLSNGRSLYLRLTSPHERGETINHFLSGIEQKTHSGRWCFAGALQVSAAGHMPDIAQTVQRFVDRFTPERTRVCFLSPDRRGRTKRLSYFNGYIETLLRVPGVEYVFIDGRNRQANGLFLADFFDFS
jgi:hypothetical protein